MEVEKIATLSSGRRESMDVAGAMAMMKDCGIGQLILLGRVNNDVKSADLLGSIIAAYLKSELGEKAPKVAKVITHEVITPKYCEKCSGRRTLTKFKGDSLENLERLEVECDQCGGMGLNWSSCRFRAKLAGIPRRTWRDWNLCEVVTAWALALEREAGHAVKELYNQ